jgi:hypothetical protein
MKYALIGLAVLILGGGAGYYFFLSDGKTTNISIERDASELGDETTDAQNGSSETDNESVEVEPKTETVLGTSVEGNLITAYHFGTGDRELLFIGGIHGGYSWNTSLVAYELMDHLAANPDSIPDSVRITVVPVMNPDGLARVVGSTGRFTTTDIPAGANTVPGRFNANTVDLNRNFDCEWQSEGVWQSRAVSGGSAAFSEPESKAIKEYVDAHDVAAAVVWYSAAGGVFASNCRNGVLPETTTLTNLYAQASGYRAYNEFNFYEITGDMVNWFAKEQIPAISVLLTDHRAVEWDKNRAGIEAMLEYYAAN